MARDSFAVHDYGPGIPAEFQEEVFQMFHTLKPRDQVEGSGMGLAMVRRISRSRRQVMGTLRGQGRPVSILPGRT